MSNMYENNMETLSEVMNSLKKEGHDLDFSVKTPGVLSTLNTDPAERFTEGISIEEVFRFEGKSNPSDNAILYLLKVRDGRTGVLVDAYGTGSSQLVSNFIKQLKPKK